MSQAFGGLVNYYDDFVPNCLPLPDGSRRTKRSAQQLAKQYNFPLVKVGLVTFIDPVIAAERLREAQLAKAFSFPRGRGRPRKYPLPTRSEPAALAALASDGTQSPK
jgi:hypothetical protein